MGEVCWDFPLLGTASKSGSNDAAITMFKGSGVMDGLAREVCQNSLDARDYDVSESKPVKVCFKLFELDRDEMSLFDGLEYAVNGAFDHWKNSNVKDDKVFDFLDNVKNCLSKDRIPVLMISDYNTTGLNGIEANDDETSYWDLLVNTEGVSGKPNEISAGSFGIGKNAPFAYSGLSTVFYNTLAKDGGRALEGVAHLVTTQKEYKGEMRPTYSTGKYLYLVDPYTGRPVFPEDCCELNRVEEFNRKSIGTDVSILGFKTEEYEEWEDAVAVAVIKNFILAIKDNKLEVEIESPTKHYNISCQTLEELMYSQFVDEPSLKWTRQIYETVTRSEPRFATISDSDENDLSIYVRYDDNYSASLSRFRSTGMLINTSTAESLPHYSIVIIANDVGTLDLSKTLRESEPPQHTEWKAKNITDNKALKSKVTKYLRRITKAIQNVLDEYEKVDITDSMDAGIGNYLPDMSDDSTEEGNDGLLVDLKISKISSNEGDVYYTSQYESGSSDSGEKDPKDGVKAGKKHAKKHTNERITVVKPGDGNTDGVSPGSGGVKLTSVELSDHRVFYRAGNKYQMIINSPRDYENVYIQFYAGRDDDNQDGIKVRNVKQDDKPLAEVDDERLGPVHISEGKNTLFVEFDNKEKLAIVPVFSMEVTSDEEKKD